MYLVLTLGENRHQTHSVSKTLNPHWNEQCEFYVNETRHLLLDIICWDKDRFGKDYLGEFDLALEEIFADGHYEQEPKWFPLKNKRTGKKAAKVSGEVLLQFTLYDAANPSATDADIAAKFTALTSAVPEADPTLKDLTPSRTPILAPTKPSTSPSPPISRRPTEDISDDDYAEYDMYDDETPEEEDPSRPESVEKRKRRLRIKGLKRKKRDNPYEFTNGDRNDVVGIIFLEVVKITDLPPESNFTKTGFDMDPFVVASLGKKTYRTKVVRHNLNPVFNEKMIFNVLGHEQSYSFAFTVIDRDRYTGNDFIASTSLPLKDLMETAPTADPETGLYRLRELPEYVQPDSSSQKSRFKRLGMSRSNSQQSLAKSARPALSKSPSQMSQAPTSVPGDGAVETTQLPVPHPGLLAPVDQTAAGPGVEATTDGEDPDFILFDVPLKMKNLEKWEAKHNPVLTLRAKYMPYPALRQQFWRSMLKQYDTDENGSISKVELTTMLDTLGSTLRDSTIDSFFKRFPHAANSGESDLTTDEAVICLEDQLLSKPKPTMTDRIKDKLPDFAKGQSSGKEPAPSEEGEILAERDDLNDRGEEHVVEIRECPICHQPRLNKRTDSDIITHIATCASQDWRQVNNLVMAGFVTASQAQRKWYSKVITKISYGGYKLGANSANILVQDRMTGQISEEKMSVYVRLGIRLLYKGLKSNNMENKRIRKLLKSLSIKQGKKYDDPASKAEIEGFIEFHKLDMSEVLLPLEDFKNFNEFFYRALKPNARPCSAPENPHIIVSPADCRSVVFNRVDVATGVWIKGREFSIKRLLGDAYPEDAARYENGGGLGIFRLAPQDYHRFHIPVDGIMGKPKLIEGEYYTVNPMAIRSALDVYGENVRVIVPIDSEKHGRVMVICVGAMMVGSTVITRQEGEHVKRAEELGYFKFGGSTIVLLFEEGKMVFDGDLVDNSNGALETLIRVGMSVGHSPNESQWAPDMRKDEKDITEQDKWEAKRRIQGNYHLEDDSDESPPASQIAGQGSG
ncbi:putative phosphatidylserine decarboxylase [Diaporthe ampelina]|uniref:Phosphatidylserine decarboxylase proenzyme 2 n=1 Tax=Diaporthe ampelina TaxID=1214573 RepID=A0A0G2FAV3_9PEZI|nr:putative phosphatidylserine decarboxylase [Diaporthe ampelina]